MQIVRVLVVLQVFLVALLAGGCASIFSGTTQTLSFQSTPEGATVTINGRIIGKTPTSATLKKEKNQAVVFALDGYKPITMQLTTHLDNWFWGNIVIGGLFGSTTDGLTGAVHQYSPSQYYVTLTPDTKTLDGKSGLNLHHKIRDFIVFRRDALAREFHGGKTGGDTFSSLAAMLSLDPAERPGAWRDLGTLERTHQDPVRYADAVLDRYRSRIPE